MNDGDRRRKKAQKYTVSQHERQAEHHENEAREYRRYAQILQQEGKRRRAAACEILADSEQGKAQESRNLAREREEHNRQQETAEPQGIVEAEGEENGMDDATRRQIEAGKEALKEKYPYPEAQREITDARIHDPEQLEGLEQYVADRDKRRERRQEYGDPSKQASEEERHLHEYGIHPSTHPEHSASALAEKAGVDPDEVRRHEGERANDEDDHGHGH